MKLKVRLSHNAGTRLHRQKKRDKEHDHKIDEQWNSHPDHIEGKLNDVFTLERKHDQDGKKKGNQGNRTDFRDEFILVPFPPLRFKPMIRISMPAIKGIPR